MDFPFFIIIVVSLIFFAFLILKNHLSSPREKYTEYRQIDNLFSPAERSFLGVLENSIPEGTRIFGKVRVADVLTPSSSANKSQWQTAFNKISAKHFDYVLCDSRTLKTIAVIELDDKSHNSNKAKVRDEFISEICQGAKLPIIRFTAKPSYTVDQVKKNILGSLYEDDTDIENADTFEEKSVVIKTDEEAHTFAAPTDKTNTTELLSSSKIAKKLKLSTDEFMKSLVDSNFLIEKNGELVLTEAGKNLGADVGGQQSL